MAGIKIKPKVIKLNLSPEVFHHWAEHFYQAYCDFRKPDGYSPVPYFLCCRAIELELKAKHLNKKSQKQVKEDFGHKLVAAYDALESQQKILNQEEYKILKEANAVYSTKGFEYAKPKDLLTGLKRIPPLDRLESITRKILKITKD